MVVNVLDVGLGNLFQKVQLFHGMYRVVGAKKVPTQKPFTYFSIRMPGTVGIVQGMRQLKRNYRFSWYCLWFRRGEGMWSSWMYRIL